MSTSVWTRNHRRLAAAIAVAMGLSCQSKAGSFAAESQPQREHTWIEASGRSQSEELARQLRGLDVAMVEMDRRYGEVYFAAHDANWPYARYQVEKMQLVMELALERRPARAASAREFFFPALNQLDEAVQQQNAGLFDERFEALRAACNGCHTAEKVPTFQVMIPAEPRSAITARPGSTLPGRGNER